ncbi:MAG TPA: hypothetical protein VEL74_23960 [Thermoanaerobaculia bacterium]|nr:hypothetical protein [Thermoanaerobaculia bacterium]
MHPQPARPAWRSPAYLLGLAAVAAARLLTLPASLWEWDEILFVKGIEDYDPVHHQPHPPGYPLLIGLGKAFNLFLNDPFHAMVALSVVSSLIGYVALAAAFQRMAGEGPAAERIAVAGSVLFHLSPTLLVYGPLALSDSPALMFLSLALAAAARLPEGTTAAALALGAAAAAAVGSRPQLCIAVLPLLAVALAFARGWRPRFLALAAFTLVSLTWFIPLVVAVGGLGELLPFLGKQADLVVRYDKELPRSGNPPGWVATRFLAHPWGTRLTSLPVLGLAAVGFAWLVKGRRWRALPLLVLSGIDLALGLAIMNPHDAVRYALPSLMAVSFAAAVGGDALARLVRLPAAAYAMVALLVAGFVIYTRPLLEARATTPSPPMQAALWAERHARYDAIFLVEDHLAAHASYLFEKFQRVPIGPGLERYAGEQVAPVYLLGDGESGWPGAVTFQWPESDAYGKLSRGLYRVTSISPLLPGRRYQVVRGVYAYEPTAREAGWRWMDDDAAIRLFPGGAARAELTLRLHPEVPWPANRVTVLVAGAPTATLEIPRGEERRVGVPLPAASRGAVEIAFRSDRAFVPTDRRRLAVQLVNVERKP